MKLLAAFALFLFTLPAIAATCSYGKVGESIMISNLPLQYGKKGPCFGRDDALRTGKKDKASAAFNPTPADFPRVDAPTQQQRDSTRRKILADELANERSALEQAKTTGKTTDITLHEKNIQMLEKEISSVK